MKTFSKPMFPNCSRYKTGHGHPRVIILRNYDGLVFLMLHTNIHGNRPYGFGRYLNGFTIYGNGVHLGHVTKIS